MGSLNVWGGKTYGGCYIAYIVTTLRMLLPRRQWIIKIDFSIKKQVVGSVVCSACIFMKGNQAGCKTTGQYFTFLSKASFFIFDWISLKTGAIEMGRS